MLIVQLARSTSLWTQLFVASCDAPLFSHGKKITVNSYSWLSGSCLYHPSAAFFPARRQWVQFIVLWIKYILCFLFPCVFLQTSSNTATAFLELWGTELHTGFNIWMYLGFSQELIEILWFILSFSLLMFLLSSWQLPHTKLTLAQTSLLKS